VQFSLRRWNRHFSAGPSSSLPLLSEMSAVGTILRRYPLRQGISAHLGAFGWHRDKPVAEVQCAFILSVFFFFIWTCQVGSHCVAIRGAPVKPLTLLYGFVLL